MDKELDDLLKRAKSVKLSDKQIEENRVALAAANGQLSNPLITLETMQATRVIMKAEEEGEKK